MGLQLKKRATGRIPDAGAQINGEPLSIEWAKSAWAKIARSFPKDLRGPRRRFRARGIARTGEVS
jgi:hypothetical protein